MPVSPSFAYRHFYWAEIDTELGPRFGARVDVGAATGALGYPHLHAVKGWQLRTEPPLPP